MIAFLFFQHFGHIGISLSKPPSVETLAPKGRHHQSRLQDTPLPVRAFMNSIRPEDSSEDDLSLPNSPKGFRKNPNKGGKRNFGKAKSVIRASSNSSLTRSNPNLASDGDDDPKSRKQKKSKLTEDERNKLIATTQFSELEMVALWNKWKFNFPTGQANRVQLRQLFKEVSTHLFGFQMQMQMQSCKLQIVLILRILQILQIY